MKVAVATDKGLVADHFGHCESFTVYEIENNRIMRIHSTPKVEHTPGFIPRYLAELGVNVIISSGMGSGAINLFNQFNIEIITGAKGHVQNIIEQYLEGKLISSNAVCHQHQHRGECEH